MLRLFSLIELEKVLSYPSLWIIRYFKFKNLRDNIKNFESNINIIYIHFTKQHQLRTEETKGSSLDKVFSIGEDSLGNIWFGTNESGVWRYDGHTLKNYTQEDGLDSVITWLIYKSKSGELWFGGGPNGVSRFTGKSFERIY